MGILSGSQGSDGIFHQAMEAVCRKYLQISQMTTEREHARNDEISATLLIFLLRDDAKVSHIIVIEKRPFERPEISHVKTRLGLNLVLTQNPQ